MTDQTQNNSDKIFQNTDEVVLSLLDCIRVLTDVLVEKKLTTSTELLQKFKALELNQTSEHSADSIFVYQAIQHMLHHEKTNNEIRALLEAKPKGEA